MRKLPENLLLAMAAVNLWSGVSLAGPFEPLFRLMKIEGECLVQRPTVALPEIAKEGKAYPYGSRVETPLNGTAVIMLAKRNLGVMGAGTVVTVTEGEGGIKRFELEHGELRVRADREAGGDLLRVVTGMATCDNLEGTVNFIYTTSLEEYRQTITCLSGETRVSGEQYRVPKLEKNHSLLIRTAIDRSLTHLLNEQGDYIVSLDSGAETPVDVETRRNSLIKIWRKHAEVGGRLIVSILVTHTDGTMSENFAYREGLGISEFYGRERHNQGGAESSTLPDEPSLDDTAAPTRNPLPTPSPTRSGFDDLDLSDPFE